MLRASEVESLGRVIADRGFVTGQAKRAGERSQRVGLIIDDQQMCSLRHRCSPQVNALIASRAALSAPSFPCFRRSSIPNVAPWLRVLRTLILAPWSQM